MNSRGPDDKLEAELSRLLDTLEDLRAELEPGNKRRLRLPSATELLRFTTEVTIPAAILVLETNVRVLKLVQRALRMAAGGDGHSSGLSSQAADLGRASLERIDDTLQELQRALEGHPTDGEARRLLEEARDLSASVDDSLGERGGSGDTVNIDIDSELESIKDDLDDEDQTGSNR